ncbi:unnamed protein product [Linum trigynum]|uniref:Uncharacterized protein n=1 Tax=Linum trigynum TaxID=586398 RepID=A0AAV2EE07_9ROSI
MIGKHRRNDRCHHGNLRFESNTWNPDESGLNLEDFRPLRFSPSSSPSFSARLPSAIQNPPIVSHRPLPFIVPVLFDPCEALQGAADANSDSKSAICLPSPRSMISRFGPSPRNIHLFPYSSTPEDGFGEVDEVVFGKDDSDRRFWSGR